MSVDPLFPSFAFGTFDWAARGYHWKTTPDVDLLADAALVSPNPWVRVCAVLERSKAGDHSESGRLIDLFESTQPFALAKTALLLFGETAPLSRLAALESALTNHNSEVRGWAASAASFSGCLSLVPAMLKAWELNRIAQVVILDS